eukprot:gene11622-8010_t
MDGARERPTPTHPPRRTADGDATLSLKRREKSPNSLRIDN